MVVTAGAGKREPKEHRAHRFHPISHVFNNPLVRNRTSFGIDTMIAVKTRRHLREQPPRVDFCPRSGTRGNSATVAWGAWRSLTKIGRTVGFIKSPKSHIFINFSASKCVSEKFENHVFRPILVRFCRILGLILTHREHNTQPTTPTTHNTPNLSIKIWVPCSQIQILKSLRPAGGKPV